MLNEWTGDIVKALHINQISQNELADELGYTFQYTSMILNGKRQPAGAQAKFEEALKSVLEKRKEAQE